MVKHRSGTWWPDDREVRWRHVRCALCTRRRWAWVSWFGIKTKVDGFSRFGLKTGGFRFPGLDLKTDRCGLVIWPTKSPRRFIGLGLKTKWAMAYWLCYNTNKRMKTGWDTRRDLVASFVWKRVGLGFPSLALRLAEARYEWCTWYHHGGHVEMKPKTDMSMRRAASDSSIQTLPFSLY
jgi:hypothetical protein